MDFLKAIKELYEHKRQLDQAIATLEALKTGASVTPPSRRGRKQMSEEERKLVSARMANYWAERRKQRGTGVKQRTGAGEQEGAPSSSA